MECLHFSNSIERDILNIYEIHILYFTFENSPRWHIVDYLVCEEASAIATLDKPVKYYVRQGNIQNDVGHVIEDAHEALENGKI